MSENTDILGFVKKYWFTAALLLIILIALWYRMGIIDSYIIPTYGNTMYHVGIERLTIQTGYYPTTEISYGGGFPHFYVPAYRLLISSMSIATGIDPMVMSGLMTITIALFILLMMFALAYRMSCNLYIALFAAFFFIMSPEMTIFTMRSLPELLGLFMVPFTFYFVLKKNWAAAIIGGAITAITHQMTLATLAAVLGLYTVFLLIRAGIAAYRKKDYAKERLKDALWSVTPIIAACVTYGIWQLYSLGTLSLMGTAQLKNHEGNVVDLPLFLRTGIFVLPFFAIGLSLVLARAWEIWEGKAAKEEKGAYGYVITAETVLFVIAWIISTLILTFNNVINPLIQLVNGYLGSAIIPEISIFPLFMDRFFTFFVQIAIILAGFGMYALLRAIDLPVLQEKPFGGPKEKV